MNANAASFFLGARSSIASRCVYISWCAMEQDDFRRLAMSMGVHL